ncbi:MAG: hypothetical protein LAQ69_48650 [Acidobacteriia bacterium]|nr:hypothetical protein [Terriglobia bacterium]
MPPFTPGFSNQPTASISQGLRRPAPRIDIVGDPDANVPAGTPGLPHGVKYFNPAAFSVPAIGSVGNAGVDIMYGPGHINHDVTLARKIALGERREFQLKLEAFNVLNHVQFTGVNSGFKFTPARWDRQPIASPLPPEDSGTRTPISAR